MNQLTAEKRDYLHSVYYDSKIPVAFSSLPTFFKFITENSTLPFSREEVKYWLLEQEVYTTNINKRKRKQQYGVTTPAPQFQYDVDSAYFKSGVGRKYFILAIDVFSRKLAARAVNNLKGQTVRDALISIFDELGKPKVIRTDLGKEYLNRDVKGALNERGIKHIYAYLPNKSNYAERAIRTVKNSLHKRMQGKGNKKWDSLLPDVINGYNNRIHSSIGMKPNDVNDKNTVDIWYSTNDERFLKGPVPKEYSYKVNDPVRVQISKNTFDKESGENFSTRIYYISDRRAPNNIARYTVKNENNQELDGTYTENELQKVIVNDDTVFRIEKILGKRTKNGDRQVKVRWQSYPPSFDTWISEEEVQRLQ